MANVSCHRYCFYCRCWLSNHHEHDHFPVPRDAGGTATVPACINCHNLKDRSGLREWPAVVFEATSELLDTFDPAELLDLAKLRSFEASRLDGLSTYARVLLAKMISLAWQGLKFPELATQSFGPS